MIGIDIYSWTKIFLLFEQSWSEILTDILENVQFFITTDVEIELLHFHPNYKDVWKSGALFPRLNNNFLNYLRLGFDEADCSLLEYSEFPEHTIITEDGPMLDLNVYSRNNIIQLADFISLLYRDDYITKKEYKILVEWLKENKNMTDKKYNRLRILNKSNEAISFKEPI